MSISEPLSSAAPRWLPASVATPATLLPVVECLCAVGKACRTVGKVGDGSGQRLFQILAIEPGETAV